MPGRAAANLWRAKDMRDGAHLRNGAQFSASDAASSTADALSAPDGLARSQDHALPQTEASGIRSGFAALDAAFFHQGWPRAGLTELLCDACGIGEFRLLAPALTALCGNEERSIALVVPPFVPYPPALEAMGVDLAKMLLIRPGDQREALWAMEQTLQTGACSAVLGWLAEASLGFANLRRLLLAARQGEAWGILFRPTRALENASAAELRLRLSPGADSRLQVNIVKRRGGWPLSGIELDLATETEQAQETSGSPAHSLAGAESGGHPA